MSEWWDLGPQYAGHWRKHFHTENRLLARLLDRTRPVQVLKRDREGHIEIDMCWTWRGPINAAGYGQIDKRTYGRIVAHRAVYEMGVGELFPDMHIHHMCGNRLCIRPDHLLQVTPKEHAQAEWASYIIYFRGKAAYHDLG